MGLRLEGTGDKTKPPIILSVLIFGTNERYMLD